VIDGDDGVPMDSGSRPGICELLRLKTEEKDDRLTGGDTGGVFGLDEDEAAAVAVLVDVGNMRAD